MVGHGSREHAGNAPLLELCRDLEVRLGITPVQPCYLELARPTIAEGLGALHRRGVERVIVVPLQLTAGRHVRYDIPCEVGRALAKLSNMAVCFTEHLGAHPTLVDVADSRLAEALAGRSLADGPTEYVLVARGSRDPLVRGEIVRWAASRRNEEFTACFLAMTRPTFEIGLRTALSRSPVRIVVQPHLLYPGRLLQRIRMTLQRMAGEVPNVEWVQVDSLGPDGRLADCVLDLAIEASERDFRREVGNGATIGLA